MQRTFNIRLKNFWKVNGGMYIYITIAVLLLTAGILRVGDYKAALLLMVLWILIPSIQILLLKRFRIVVSTNELEGCSPSPLWKRVRVRISEISSIKGSLFGVGPSIVRDSNGVKVYIPDEIDDLDDLMNYLFANSGITSRWR